MTVDEKRAYTDLAWCLLGLLLSVAMLAGFIWLVEGLSDAAPAPPPRPARRAPVFPVLAVEVAGEWTMRWNGTKCPTMFYVSGDYTCLYGASSWAGTWKVKDGWLHIHESSDDTHWHRWRVELMRTPRGLKAREYAPVHDFALER